MFYAGVIVVAPGLFLAIAIFVERREQIYVRYFLIAVLFLLLLMSRLLARLFEQGKRGKILYGVLLLAFLCGNAIHTNRLIRLGRGAYLDAIEMMQQETADGPITVGGNNDFCNGMVLKYNLQWLERPGRFVYVPLQQWPPNGPEWFLRIEITPSPNPPPDLEVKGNRYRLFRGFPYAGLSGWHWFVYRNENRLPAG